MAVVAVTVAAATALAEVEMVTVAGREAAARSVMEVVGVTALDSAEAVGALQTRGRGYLQARRLRKVSAKAPPLSMATAMAAESAQRATTAAGRARASGGAMATVRGRGLAMDWGPSAPCKGAATAESAA